jgi:hypothetical protein
VRTGHKGCPLTSCSTESASASLAFEVLRFLVIDENLEIIEVALTVVAPRTRQDLIEIGMITLLFRHPAGRSR